MLVRFTLDLLNCAVQELAQLLDPPRGSTGNTAGPGVFRDPLADTIRLGPFLTGPEDYRRFSIPLILRLISPATPVPPAVRPAEAS